MRRKSQIPNPKSQRNSKFQTPKSRAVWQRYRDWIWIVTSLFVPLAPAVLLADTNPVSSDEIPPLRAPRGEIPPTFWEQYGQWVIVGTVVVVVVACVAIWFLTRPSPPVVIAAAIQARRALEPLCGPAEDGVVLSKVSQILRH